MAVQTLTLQQKRGLSSDWTTKNPSLLPGELGFETDTLKFKIGTGTSATPWNSLSYVGTGSGGSSSYQIDGGLPSSVYGGTTPVDGGTP
jgi:Major tropism determinant N-terminal domain